MIASLQTGMLRRQARNEVWKLTCRMAMMVRVMPNCQNTGGQH